MESPRKKFVSSEAVVTLGIAVVIAIGSFFILQTSLKYDEKNIDRIDGRVGALEARERKDRDILIRVDQHVKVLDDKIDKVLKLLGARTALE